MSSSSSDSNSSDAEADALAFEDHMQYIRTIFDHKGKNGISYEDFKEILNDHCYVTF